MRGLYPVAGGADRDRQPLGTQHHQGDDADDDQFPKPMSNMA